MGALSPWHWAILAVVIVLMFGANRLPGAARSLGTSMRIFKTEMKELHDDPPTNTTTLATHDRAGEATPGKSPGPERPANRTV